MSFKEISPKINIDAIKMLGHLNSEQQEKKLQRDKELEAIRVEFYSKEISNLLQVNEEKKRNMSQAVGGAVGHNPLSIIIPCHRVVGTDGSMTGYAGGLEKKKALLTLEQAHLKK